MDGSRSQTSLSNDTAELLLMLSAVVEPSSSSMRGGLLPVSRTNEAQIRAVGIAAVPAIRSAHAPVPGSQSHKSFLASPVLMS